MDIKFPKIGGNNPTGGASESSSSKNSQAAGEKVNDKFSSLISQLGEQLTPAALTGNSPANSAALAPTRAALAQIASLYNLSLAEEATAAVRRSARLLITNRLDKKLLGKQKTEEMIDDLSEYVASDPLLKGKLLDILERAKA